MIYCQQIPLVINHDWADTIAAMHKLEKINRASEIKDLKSVTTQDVGYQENHRLGNFGVLSRHNVNPDWTMGREGIVDKTMPWLPELLEVLKEIGPTDYWVGSMQGEVSAHIDKKDRSALNYVIQCEDPCAYTWIDDGKITEQYPSTPNTAWLVNAKVKHGISNIGQRYTFSIRFDKPYADVRDWFNSHTNNLTFGNKENKQ